MLLTSTYHVGVSWIQSCMDANPFTFIQVRHQLATVIKEKDNNKQQQIRIINQANY